MVGWHHQLDGHEFEQDPEVGDGQGSLACCSPWGHKELDTTEQLKWTELKPPTMVQIRQTHSWLLKTLSEDRRQKNDNVNVQGENSFQTKNSINFYFYLVKLSLGKTVKNWEHLLPIEIFKNTNELKTKWFQEEIQRIYDWRYW